MSKVRILVVAANPEGTALLNTNEEVKEIQDAIHDGILRESFEPLRFAPQSSAQDLITQLQRIRPHIVHFSGHGTEQEELLFAEEILVEERDEGQPNRRFRRSEKQPIDPETLSKIFDVGDPNPRLVVLNACYSAPQARAIARHVDCVVGIRGQTYGLYARKFAFGLYAAMADGHSVGNALKTAHLQMKLVENESRHSLPEICVETNGAEPHSLWLCRESAFLTMEPSDDTITFSHGLATTPKKQGLDIEGHSAEALPDAHVWERVLYVMTTGALAELVSAKLGEDPDDIAAWAREPLTAPVLIRWASVHGRTRDLRAVVGG